jgi:DNA primase
MTAASGDVPDHRPARAGHRLRRPRARQGRAAKYSTPERRSSTRATLYNIAAARVAAHTAGGTANSFSAALIVVEGYVDVIAMVTRL